MAEAKTPAKTAKKTAAKQPNLTIKGERTFRHDLFKGKVATMKKNMSYKAGEPNLIPIEHTHVFHTFNSHGKPQTRTNTVGNHFHEVTWGMDPETGNLIAKCGPPLMKDKKRSKTGHKRSKIVPVRFFDGEKEVYIEDNHTHDMEYIVSEELNADTLRKLQNSNATTIIEAGKATSFENDEVKMTVGAD